MANALMMRYAASRGANDNRPYRMADGDGKYQERGIGTDEHGYRLPFREPRPEFGETEARYRDEDDRYKKPGETEARYRGEDGRYKSGRRTSEMNDREKKWEFKVTPQDEYRGPMDEYSEYMPPEPGPYGRRIGYGEMDGDRQMTIGFGENRRMHYEEEMPSDHKYEMGRSRSHEDPLPMDEHTAKEWVKEMKNRDEKFPHGERWPAELLKPYAQRYGIPTSGPEFWEFYAIVHAMYSDFYPVGKKYGAKDGSPEFYVCLAKYWLDDEDAVEDKAAAYYDFVVKHKNMIGKG